MTVEAKSGTAAATAHRTAPHAAAILPIVLISYFMILLDNSVIFTGLPSLQSDLHLSSAALSWVQDAYTLVFGGLLLLGARAGDLVGRRRLFVGGLAVFGLASLLVAIADSGEVLIAARALQGIGAAVVAPTSLSLIAANFEGRARARAIALYGATAGIGASLGLLVGGAAAEWFSWRAGFLINVPIAAFMAIAALHFLPSAPRSTGRFDVTGALTATVGVGALVYGVVESADAGWTAPPTVIAIAVGFASLVALVITEARAQQPIIPLRLFRSRQRSGAYAIRMLYMGAMMGFFFFTTQFMQAVLGFTPLQAGAGFLPMTAANFVVAMLIPRLTSRFSGGLLLSAGVLVTLLGMVWLSCAGSGAQYWTAIAAPMVAIGIGQGLAFAPMTSAGVTGVASSDSGAASGLVNTAHQLGSSLGLGLLVTLAARTHAQADSPAAVADRFEAALTGGSALLAIGAAVAVVCVAGADRRPVR